MVSVLASQGIHAGQVRVGQSLARVQPTSHQRKANRTERQTNPIPYSAKYFGHKVYILTKMRNWFYLVLLMFVQLMGILE